MRFSFILLVMSFIATTLFSQGTTFSASQNSEESPDILFVIKVPTTEENTSELAKIKQMKAEGVTVKESVGFLEIHYVGEQLTSAVDPSFIEEIKVYKNEKAKEAYPSATTDSVIEMVVKDAKVLVDVFDAIKAM